MKKGKPLSALATDIKQGLALGMEAFARDVVINLKMDGPYWTGEFEANWRINLGWQREVEILKQGLPQDYDTPASPRPGGGYTEFRVPRMSEDLEGYNIGNVMSYRNVATDLEPGEDGWRYDRDNPTAVQDWFTSYVLGVMEQDLIENIRAGLRLIR